MDGNCQQEYLQSFKIFINFPITGLGGTATFTASSTKVNGTLSAYFCEVWEQHKLKMLITKYLDK